MNRIPELPASSISPSYINEEIQRLKGIGLHVGAISDGYHTFDELYEHRYQLFIALCKSQHYIWHAEHWDNDKKTSDMPSPVYKTRVHYDGTPAYEGYFVLMLDWGDGRPKQMSYHLPERMWDQLGWCREQERVTQFDGHTSADVLKRIAEL